MMKQIEPKYFSELRKLLDEVYEMMYDSDSLVGSKFPYLEFHELMAPYGLKRKHVTKNKLRKGVYVILPDTYSEIEELRPGYNKWSIEELQYYLCLEEIEEMEDRPGIPKHSITITSGGPPVDRWRSIPPHGDPWYTPRIKLVRDLKRFIQKYRRSNWVPITEKAPRVSTENLKIGTVRTGLNGKKWELKPNLGGRRWWTPRPNTLL